MVFYFVQRGETLYAIAKRYATTVHAIVVANRLEDPNAIRPGQALIIPRPGEVPSPPPGGIVHLVRPGETVFHLATRFGASVPEILRANQVAHPEFVLSGQQLVIPEQVEAGEDWPMLGRTPGRASASPVLLEGHPVPGWTFQPRRSQGVRPSAPVVRYDRVYAGLGDGYFYALDRINGRVKWRVPGGGARAADLLGQHSLATPAIFDGLAYLATADGTLHAVDAHTGQWIWKVALGGTVSSSPAVYDGVVYLGTWEGGLCALEAKTGAVAWRQTCSGPITQPVAAGDGHLYVTTDAGELWALRHDTGEVAWNAPAPDCLPPVFAEVLVLCGGRAHDPRTGEIAWQVESASSPVTYFDQVLFPWGAVDLFSGEAERTEGGAPEVAVVPQSPKPAVRQVAAGALRIAVTEDHQVEARLLGDERFVWSFPLAEVSNQPPAIAPDQMVLTTAEGGVVTYTFTDE